MHHVECENKYTKVKTRLWRNMIAADGTYLWRWETQRRMKKEEVKRVQKTGENGDEDGRGMSWKWDEYKV